jgi:hypothetical protein
MAGQHPNRPIKGDKQYFIGTKIDGFIEYGDSVTEDEFYTKFIQWIEANDWTFGGGMEHVEEEHDYKPNHDPNEPLDPEDE